MQTEERREVLVPFPKHRARRAIERSVEERLGKAIEAAHRLEDATSLLPEFISLIDHGCAEANYFAACILEEGGGGIPPDMDKAIFYYKRAVEEIGYLEAALALARIYYYGIGTSRNYPLAGQYYQTILESHFHPIASLMLGRMYRLGQGVPQDLPRAETLLDRAAEAENVYAIQELSILRHQQKRWISALALRMKAGWRAFRIGSKNLRDARLRKA